MLTAQQRDVAVAAAHVANSVGGRQDRWLRAFRAAFAHAAVQAQLAGVVPLAVAGSWSALLLAAFADSVIHYSN